MVDCTRNKLRFWVFFFVIFLVGGKKKWSWVWWKWETFKNCFKVNLNQNELGGVKNRCRVIASSVCAQQQHNYKRKQSSVTNDRNWKGILWLAGGESDCALALSCLLRLGKLLTFLRRASDASKTCLVFWFGGGPLSSSHRTPWSVSELTCAS